MLTIWNKRKNLIRFCILCAYCFAMFYLFYTHENWRDEAQAWLLARDLNLWELIQQMAYEGHLCLWHLLLKPLTMLNLPYFSMNILSMLFVASAAGWMLWKAPIPLPWQAAALFSSAMLFHLPVVSRSYCLIPAFLFFNATVYPSRHEKPLLYGLSIALLVQTHIFMLGLAGILSLFWLGEAIGCFRKSHDKSTFFKQGAGLTLPFISFLFLLVQVAGASKKSIAYVFDWNVFQYFDYYLNYIFKVPRYLLTPIVSFAFYASFVLVFVLGFVTKNHPLKKCCCLFLGGYGAMIVMAAVLQRLSRQKAALIVPLVLWFAWISWPHLKTYLLKGIMLIALSVTCMVYLWNGVSVFREAPLVRSGSQACAQFINENLPDDALIVQNSDTFASAVLPYLEQKGFYSINTGKYVSYVTLTNQAYQTMTYQELCDWARQIAPTASEVYFLYCPEAYTELESFEDYMNEKHLLYETPELPIISNERYQIYRIPLQTTD